MRRRVLALGAITRQADSIKKLLSEGAVESKKTHTGVRLDGVAHTASMDEEKVAAVRLALVPLLRARRRVRPGPA